MENEYTKICNRCKKNKRLNDFCKNKISKDGFNYMCKECVRLLGENYRKNNPDKEKVRHKEYKQRNVEKIKRGNKIYREKNKDKEYLRQKEWNRSNPQKVKERDKRYRLKNSEKRKNLQLKYKFHVDTDLYNAMSISQNNVCAICGKPETTLINKKTNKTRRLAVDHNHKNSEIRGLLCHNCNVLLGYADDSILLLEAAINYLKKYNERNKNENN